jgi:spermidine synthase
MAYLPKVVRPNANDFLDVAFGMGTTYRSAINLGMRTDAVDLSPTVPRMMPVFYADAEKYLNNPLGRVVTADGRNYVRLTSRRYDIVSVDPPPPIQSAGTVVLYTREFYADAHRHLRRDGLMTEWLYFGVNLAELPLGTRRTIIGSPAGPGRTSSPACNGSRTETLIDSQAMPR